MVRRLLLLLPVLLLAPLPASAGMCALCRQALASGGNLGLIRGFYWSILLIAGMPLFLLAVGGWLIRRHRERP